MNEVFEKLSDVFEELRSEADEREYENMSPIHIAKNYEELAEKDSIFSIVKQTRLDQNERKPISFSLDSDRIKIYVDEEVYASYIRYKGMQSLMMSLLVMPALTYMLETLMREGTEQYESDYWFIKLQKFYKLRGKDFIQDIVYGDVLISEEVQEMLQLPISSTMLSIPMMLGE